MFTTEAAVSLTLHSGECGLQERAVCTEHRGIVEGDLRQDEPRAVAACSPVSLFDKLFTRESDLADQLRVSHIVADRVEVRIDANLQ